MLTIPKAIAQLARANHFTYLNRYTYGITPGITLADLPDFIYGSYCGIVLPLCGVIVTVVMMFNRATFPTLASAFAEHYRTSVYTRVRKLSRTLLLTASAVSLPAGIALALFAPHILHILYPTRAAEAAVALSPLVLSAVAAVLSSLCGTLLCILTAAGKNRVQFALAALCAVVKIVGNVTLVPLLGVNGAVAANIISFAAAGMAGAAVLRRMLRGQLAA
ncbi:hypothetical protein FACS1894133_7100 [Clostridia bacterium]|nr:hypothetical protein FACS1894133_7100 [Clostridia bacterium]